MAQPNIAQAGVGTLKFCSWNCKGLNQPVKRSKVLHHLQHLNAHIVYLQETHLRLSDQAKLRTRWVSQVYHSSFQSKCRGVAILIHKKVHFVCTNVLTDPNGRYVVITGQLHGTPVVLANIYGPNWDNENFFQLLFSKLPNISSHLLILGGDFNCWLNPSLDRSSTKIRTPLRSAKIISSFMKEFSISDPWRLFNPSGREYSFFSQVHHTFTRIDYFLIDNRLIPSVRSCSYDAIVISDHAPVIMDLCMKRRDSIRPPWRFRVDLLSDVDFVNFISREIDFFLVTNRTPGISPSLLWETLKAFLRGQIISYTAYSEKLRKEKLSTLTKQITQLDRAYAISPSSDIFKERLTLQAEFDVLSTAHVENLLLKSGHTFYEQGDKVGKLLAHQLRQSCAAHQILQIQTQSGVTTDLKQINEQFKQFYMSLYTSEQTTNPSSVMDDFFDLLKMPGVDPDLTEKLEAEISVDELKKVVYSMQSGKCPGLDGYPVEFYRTFIDKLAPILIDMYNESFILSKLPSTLTQASISLILKKNKDPLSCASYRPISLLSVDLKLLSKLLAKRLESVLPSIISPDQTGFIQNRHSFFNIRRLLNIVYNSTSCNTPEAIILLDAEKAFDRVEWQYLFYTLEKFGFGKNFITWVKLLYTNPTASVRTNNTYSEQFPLHRSTRQGCNLSPLLFAIAIEPLAIALRSNPSITGVIRDGVEHKLSLYADDLVLYLSNISVSIPTMIDVFYSFGQISGYKLNLDKSELFPLNIAAREYPLQNFPFKVALHNFTYLGIKITNKFENLYSSNYDPVLTRLKEDFERWSLLPLSLVARVNTVKMNSLPKLSYLFQCLPIFLPQSFFCRLDGMVSQFIWNKKTARLSKALLQRPKLLGGLALPNFKFYYWAANLRILQNWIKLEKLSSCPAWVNLEASSSRPASLTSLIHAPLSSFSSLKLENIIVKSTLRIWNQFRRHFDLKTVSSLTPIALNPIFGPSLMDGTFGSWSALGINTLKDLYIDNIFASFQQLSERYTLPRRDFFRYLQIRSFARSVNPTFPNLPDTTSLDSFVTPLSSANGLISTLYNLIHSLRPTTLLSVKKQWEGELGSEISSETWEIILRRIHSSSICARHGLIQCKIVHRIHFTKVRLAKIFDVDPSCDRCHQAPATHVHMFWSCPSLYNYWSEIFNTISICIKTPLDLNASTALFGVPPIDTSLSKYKADFIAFTTLLARRLILLRWKSSSPPSHSQWIMEILRCVKMEKIRYTIRGSLSTYKKMWEPFFVYVRSLQSFVIPE